MINQRTYTSEWIETFKSQEKYRKVNPALFERMIYAFSLLESLANTGFDFIFKGGTSLMLMDVNFNRFSVDIDITTQQGKAALEESLHKLIPDSVFSSFSEDIRPDGSLTPKAHYVFYYPAKANKEGIILLDVIFEDSPYTKTIQQKIENEWISTSEPFSMVTIPTVNGILGDKLTAFAPSTIGVPYCLGEENKMDKSIEIIKQLHDVSLLIDHCSDMEETWLVFKQIAARQIGYRQTKIGLNEVVEDIYSTALTLARRDKNKEEPFVSRFNELQQGINKFGTYLISGNFKIEDAIAASAKAAFFSQALIMGERNGFSLFNNTIDMKDWEIRHPDYIFLNRFKKTNKPTFFYWHKCLDIKKTL